MSANHQGLSHYIPLGCIPSQILSWSQNCPWLVQHPSDKADKGKRVEVQMETVALTNYSYNILLLWMSL